MREAVAVLGAENEPLISQLATEICKLTGFDEAPAEKVLDAVASRLVELEETMRKELQKDNESGGGTGKQPGPPGPSSAAAGSQQPPGVPGSSREPVSQVGLVTLRDHLLGLEEVSLLNWSL
jgi:hypothetical protein